MQRHRNNNQSNGFRSNMYRNYNNRGGYGRPHHQQQQPRRIDVFYEAGKLAADYLLAKGLLNPNNNNNNSLNNNKWQNSNNNLNVVSDSVSGSSSRRRSLDDPRGDSSVRRALDVKSPVVESTRDVRSEEKVDESVSVKDEERKLGLEDVESKNVEEMVVEERKEVSAENVVEKNDVLDGDENEVESEVKDNVAEDVTMDEVKEEVGDETSVKEEVMDENENENENKKDEVEEGGSDLLTFKVPTKTRSSVSLKGSKSDPVLICGDENNKVESEKVSQEVEVKTEEVVNDEVKKVKPVASDEDDMYKFGLGLHMRSQSFPQRAISELEINDGVLGYSRCSSEVLGRGEKRPMEMNDNVEITKKQKDWVSGLSANPQFDSYFPLSGSRGDQSSSQEKQLFPNSFKICDLNLMGGSEANENHDTSSVMGFGQAKQEPVSVGFDLTMNNSCGIGDRHITHGADGKGVEVIDLDCDVQDDNNNAGRDEAIFTDLESFPDSMQRVDNEDGYGLMISELLDADIPNSSVSTGVNSMHNEMSLHNEEEILGDDESIYMSLGEIPISMPKL